jgi:hypothetical protein
MEIMARPASIREPPESTITILLNVNPGYAWMRKLQVRMRRSMSFGQVVSLLRAKFKDTENHHLHLRESKRSSSEERIIFDSDTPDSVRSSLPKITCSYTKCLGVQLRLKVRAKLEFVSPLIVEPMDISNM